MNLQLTEYEWPQRGMGVPPFAPFGGARWGPKKEPALQALGEPFVARLFGV